MNYTPGSPEFNALKRLYDIYEREPDKTGGEGRYFTKIAEAGLIPTLEADGYIVEMKTDYYWATSKVKTDWEAYLAANQPVPTPDLDRARIVELLAKLENDTITNAELKEVVKRDLKRRYL